ncbi:MAG: hypothetical protein HY475_00740 [Candidatus Terrybacteria bacterium]|nr:hypothetical protein [Candidatus Terrybacteria bacterium]
MNEEHVLKGYMKRVAIAIGAGLLGFGIGLFAIHVLIQPVFPLGDATRPQKPPLLTLETPDLRTDVDRFLEQYGPWLSANEAAALRVHSGVRNLAFLRGDGSVAYAAGTADFVPAPPWTVSRPPEITGVAVSGTSITIRDNRGNRFTLNATQPFVFQTQLGFSYCVDQTGEIWSAPLAALFFGPADLGAGSGIAPNPALTGSY